MGFREDLLVRLSPYSPSGSTEERAKADILAFVAANEVLGRANPAGHITGSALVVNPDRTMALLNHHAKLDKWVQFGGHVEDWDETVRDTALREAREESGIERLTLVSEGIFDIDVHPIPARPGQGAHFHYDIRFLLAADGGAAPTASEESKSVKWVKLGDIAHYSTSESMLRMARKAADPARRGGR